MKMNKNFGRRVFKHGLVFTTTILTCTALRAENNDEPGNKAEMFIQKALKGGRMEVQMGQLAQQNGQSQEVKNFGGILVRDHTQANQKLEQLASIRNIRIEKDLGIAPSTNSLPAQPGFENPQKNEHGLAKLQGKSGLDFDKAFVRMAIKDHKKDIAEFENARTEASDAEIKSFIDETLPKLRQHLQMANSAARSVGVDESSAATDESNEKDSVGSPAPAATGTVGSDNPLLDKDRSPTENSVPPNNSSTTRGGHSGNQSVSTSADLNQKNYPEVSVESGAPRRGKLFQKGDGKVLGLSTDKNDGKFLGIIPDPIKRNRESKHDDSVKADFDVNGHDASVGGYATTETGGASNSDSK